MKTTRKQVFETNSSSTHSMTILPKEDYDRWAEGKVYLDKDEEIVLTKEDILAKIIKDGYFCEGDDIDSYIRDNNIITFDEFGEYLEYDFCHYKTKSGDEIVVFCEYGYDS